MIYDDVKAMYPGMLTDNPPRSRYEPLQRRYGPPACDHDGQFVLFHRHLDEVAAQFHHHLYDLQETIMAAIDDLKAAATDYDAAVQNTVIPALNALMAAVASGAGGIPEADVAAVVSQLQATTATLTQTAQQAAATVGGAG